MNWITMWEDEPKIKDLPFITFNEANDDFELLS